MKNTIQIPVAAIVGVALLITVFYSYEVNQLKQNLVPLEVLLPSKYTN